MGYTGSHTQKDKSRKRCFAAKSITLPYALYLFQCMERLQCIKLQSKDLIDLLSILLLTLSCFVSKKIVDLGGFNVLLNKGKFLEV